jgi:hypothetical protein
MLLGCKTFKTPYFSVTDRNRDKVRKMLDERYTILKQLTEQMGILPEK